MYAKHKHMYPHKQFSARQRQQWKLDVRRQSLFLSPRILFISFGCCLFLVCARLCIKQNIKRCCQHERHISNREFLKIKFHFFLVHSFVRSFHLRYEKCLNVSIVVRGSCSSHKCRWRVTAMRKPKRYEMRMRCICPFAKSVARTHTHTGVRSRISHECWI